MKTAPHCLLTLLACLGLAVSPAVADPADFAGAWAVDRAASGAIDPWSQILLEITVNGDTVTLARTFSTGLRRTAHAYPLKLGERVSVPMTWWTGNRHIGAYMGGDMTEKVESKWADGGNTLVLESHYVLATSQGETPVRSHIEYRISADGSELTVIELRSSRNKPLVQVFRRAPATSATNLK